MHKEQDKYQNILTHLHELNRQNLLDENDRNEYLSNELEKVNNKIDNISSNNSKNTNKLIIIVILLLIINTAIILFIGLKPSIEQNKTLKTNTENVIKEVKPEIQENENNGNIAKKELDPNINTFDSESIDILEVEEEFKEIVPIIRKGTPYTCKDDVNTYKIPYTVDIKGKLYSNRFTFILQEKSGTKECSIKKEEM
jgi:hypothetical protein